MTEEDEQGRKKPLYDYLPRDVVVAALEQAVMVIAPGDALIVRVPGFLKAPQVAAYQRQIDELLKYHEVNCHVLVLPGEQFALADTHDAPEPEAEEAQETEETEEADAGKAEASRPRAKHAGPRRLIRSNAT